MTYIPGGSEPRREPLGPPAYTTPVLPSAPPQFPPHVVQPLPPKKRRTGLIVAGALAVLVLLAGGAVLAAGLVRHGSPLAGSHPSPAWSPIDWGKQTPAAPAPVALPKTTDFTLAVKVLKKSCFGSAGCNITYRIDPTYNGAPFPSGVKFEVVYQVNGGQDPQINHFTIGAGDGPGNSWQASVQDEEMIQTKSSSAVLTAVVTDVSQA